VSHVTAVLSALKLHWGVASKSMSTPSSPNSFTCTAQRVPPQTRKAQARGRADYTLLPAAAWQRTLPSTHASPSRSSLAGPLALTKAAMPAAFSLSQPWYVAPPTEMRTRVPGRLALRRATASLMTCRGRAVSGAFEEAAPQHSAALS
jgi:hypothetical protein